MAGFLYIYSTNLPFQDVVCEIACADPMEVYGSCCKILTKYTSIPLTDFV